MRPAFYARVSAGEFFLPQSIVKDSSPHQMGALKVKSVGSSSRVSVASAAASPAVSSLCVAVVKHMFG